MTWGLPRDRTRVLNHAAQCGYLAAINKDLVQEAVEELARKTPGIMDYLNSKVGIVKKCMHKDLSTSSSAQTQTPEDSSSTSTPPLKRSKTEPLLTVVDISASKSKQVVRPGQNYSEMYQTEGKKAIKEKADQALVEFIICCGIPPRVLQKRHFRDFVSVLNGKYSPPSRSTFEDSLVPSYAAAVRVAIINHLKECRDLMFSFDGGKLRKKKFYSVHATTPNRQSFCLDLDDVTRLSQTGEYIFELLKKVCDLTLLSFLSISEYVLRHCSGLIKLVLTAGVVLHQTMRPIVARLNVSLLNIIREYLTWRMLAIIFTMGARIFAIYLNSKGYFFHLKFVVFHSFKLTFL